MALFKGKIRGTEQTPPTDSCGANELDAIQKDIIYKSASASMKFDLLSDLESAIKKFRQIPEWRDSEGKIRECEERIKYLEERTRKRKKIKLIVLLALFVIISANTVFKLIIEPNNKYNDALAQKEAGNIVEAYEALLDLNGYKDSAEQAEAFYDEYKFEKLKTAKLGDHVRFGRYEQDGDITNGKEKIEWLVLEIKDGKALIISKYLLDCREYDTGDVGINWGSSSVRAWLNNEFLSSAFSEEELSRILVTEISADPNPTHKADQGDATEDRIFLLSVAEANKYFPSNMARRCKATAYTRAKGVEVIESCGDWWLRTIGINGERAAVVSLYGSILDFGYNFNNPNYAIRPALWIDLGN